MKQAPMLQKNPINLYIWWGNDMNDYTLRHEYYSTITLLFLKMEEIFLNQNVVYDNYRVQKRTYPMSRTPNMAYTR